MKTLSITLAVYLFLVAPAQAQTLIFEENFEGGAADWVNFDRTAVTHNATGGHDGGAYISWTDDIVTDPLNERGSALIKFRCAIAPSQLPSQNCSNAGFVGDWWMGLGVQELRFWIRHSDSTYGGGVQPYIRIPMPGNTPGASAIFAAIPANDWREIVLVIDPQNPEFESQWGGSNAFNILTNIGRLQPGVFFPFGVDYSSPGSVTFDIDDVRILGTTPTPAVIDVQPVVHTNHNGLGGNQNDRLRVVVLGSSTGAGDPVDLDTDDIDINSLRFGPRGAAIDPGLLQQSNIDHDLDGIDDVRARFRQGSARIACSNTDASLRGELSTGELFVGTDTITTACNAGCH